MMGNLSTWQVSYVYWDPAEDHTVDEARPWDQAVESRMQTRSWCGPCHFYVLVGQNQPKIVFFLSNVSQEKRFGSSGCSWDGKPLAKKMSSNEGYLLRYFWWLNKTKANNSGYGPCACTDRDFMQQEKDTNWGFSPFHQLKMIEQTTNNHEYSECSPKGKRRCNEIIWWKIIHN